MINLDKIPGDLLTSARTGPMARAAHAADGYLRRVADMANPLYGHPDMIEALLLLDAATKEELGIRLRITEVFRPAETARAAAARYAAWVADGRPEPGSRRYDPVRHKTAYVAPPEGSNHSWGGAVDLDVGAMALEWVRVRPAEAGNGELFLSRLWELAAVYELCPIVHEPDLAIPECWHFDLLGPAAKQIEQSAGYVRRRYFWRTLALNVAYGHAGRLGLSEPHIREAQVMLLLAGFTPGVPDGVLGERTATAIRAACGEFTPVSVLTYLSRVGETRSKLWVAPDVLSGALNAAGVVAAASKVLGRGRGGA